MERGIGAPLALVATQLSMAGLYRPPLPNTLLVSSLPHNIISFLVQTTVCAERAAGAPMTLVATQLSMAGLYRPPLLTSLLLQLLPPQTIISLPVQTAV